MKKLFVGASLLALLWFPLASCSPKPAPIPAAVEIVQKAVPVSVPLPEPRKRHKVRRLQQPVEQVQRQPAPKCEPHDLICAVIEATK